ncbi:MAG TPA: nicotinamide-nucleotide adenylyltransferase [archaeon]|nr:nicotinamide-nucleotide adenylyltransferase [archaeon]
MKNKSVLPKVDAPFRGAARRGLFVGRFQPYHFGHHNALLNALKKVDEMVIVVGSSKESFQPENPFTAGERIEMIGSALKESGLFEKCYIIPVDDIQEYALWTQRTKSFSPKFEIVFTNNPLVKELFEADGFEVEKLVSNSKHIESTKVRNTILSGKSLSEFVPKSVEKYLKEINAQKRIKSITGKEVKQ